MRPKYDGAGSEKPIDNGGSGARDVQEVKQLSRKSGNVIQSKAGGMEDRPSIMMTHPEKLLGGPKTVEY